MAGQAHGIDRAYQALCRDLILRYQHRFGGELEPYSGEGVDVRFELGLFRATFDVALKDRGGRLVVIECKRWDSGVPQGALFEFAYKVDQLRKGLGVEVAGLFMVSHDVQHGTLRSAALAGVDVVRVAANQPWPNHAFTFVAYNAERDARWSGHNAFIYEEVGPITDHVPVRVSRGRTSVPPRRTDMGYELRCRECPAQLDVVAADIDGAADAFRAAAWSDLNDDDTMEGRSWLCPECGARERALAQADAESDVTEDSMSAKAPC